MADISFNFGWLILWSYAELSIGIVAASLLSVPKLAQVKGWKLESAISTIRQPFTYIRVQISSKGFSRTGPKEPDVAIEQENVVAPRKAPEADLVFETESHHLHTSPPGPSRV
jgi:hypothetical protein